MHKGLTGPRRVPVTKSILLGVVLTGLVLVLYLTTVAPGVLGGDARELQFVPYILSLAHPTGYPLHTLVGKVWATVLPVGSVAFRMNCFSSLAAVVALVLLYTAVLRLTGSSLATFGAALWLGVSRVFWSQAIIADKYALNALLFSSVLFTFLAWMQGATPFRLRWCVFTCGLSLTHHCSMLTLLLPLFLYILQRAPRVGRDRGRVAPALGWLVLPLFLYLWLPIGAARGLPPGTWRPASLAGWLDFVFVLDRGFLPAIQPHVGLRENMVFFFDLLRQQFALYGIGWGVVGLARQIYRRADLGLTLSAAFLLHTVLAAGYRQPRVWVFLLPSFILFALWIGESLAWLEIEARRLWRRSPIIGFVFTATALISVTGQLVLIGGRNYAFFWEQNRQDRPLDLWRQDLKAGYQAQRFALNSLTVVEPSAIIVADWEQATPLWYFQQVEGWRRDVTVLYPIERWPEALATGRPTYVTRPVIGLGAPYHLLSVGPLVRIGRQPCFEPPLGVTPIDINWAGKIALVGYRLYRSHSPSARLLPVSVYFRALESLSAEPYSFSLRLFDGLGNQIWSEDRQHLSMGMSPTTQWLPGEVVGEYFEVPLPREPSSGPYRLGVVVYSVQGDGGWYNLPVVNGQGEIGTVFTIESWDEWGKP